jgi:hypothetical protein
MKVRADSSERQHSKEVNMSVSDAQKSEVHTSTGDASSSPVGSGDQEVTRSASRPQPPSDQPKWPLESDAGTKVIKDDTDTGGPLVIKSDDPRLNPPVVPRDPFPTERKPEIDPPAPPGKRA